MGEEQTQQHIAPVGRSDDDAPLEEPVQDVGHGHRSDDEPEGLAVEERLVAMGEGAGDRSHQLTHGGGVEHRLGRDGVCRDVPEETREGLRGGLEGGSGDAVGDDGQHLGVVGACLVGRDVRGGSDLLGEASGARDDEDHRSVEVGRDPCVVGELRRRRDVRVVRADDEHRLVVARDRVEAVHDRRHRPLGVGMDVVVADTGGRDVGEACVEPRQQQVEHVVARGILGPDDRPEHPHPPHPAAELVEQPERDGGLAGQAFGGGEVDAGCHGVRLSGCGRG